MIATGVVRNLVEVSVKDISIKSKGIIECNINLKNINKSSLIVFPLTYTPVNYIYNNGFVQSYLYTNICKLYKYEILVTINPEYFNCNTKEVRNLEFINLYKNLYIFKTKVKEEYYKDYELILKGKYSEISIEAKKCILNTYEKEYFSTNKNSFKRNLIYILIFPLKENLNLLENELNVTSNSLTETFSIINIKNETFLV